MEIMENRRKSQNTIKAKSQKTTDDPNKSQNIIKNLCFSLWTSPSGGKGLPELL